MFNLEKNQFLAEINSSLALSPEQKKQIQMLLIGDPTKEDFEKANKILVDAIELQLSNVEGIEPDTAQSNNIYMNFKAKTDQINHDLDHEIADSENEIQEAEELIEEK